MKKPENRQFLVRDANNPHCFKIVNDKIFVQMVDAGCAPFEIPWNEMMDGKCWDEGGKCWEMVDNAVTRGTLYRGVIAS